MTSTVPYANMDTQESANRDILHPESIEKKSEPDTTSADSISIRIDEDDLNTTEQQYVTGSKLHLIVIALTLACFLMTLSSSVLATVCE